MRLEIRLDGASLRQWHLSLLERLARLPGIVVTCDASPCPGGLSLAARMLLHADALLQGVAFVAMAPVAPARLAPYRPATHTRADLILDLCGDVRKADCRLWRLTFDHTESGGRDDDGLAGDMALFGLLVRGEAPVATIREGGTMIAIGRLGTEHNGTVLSALEDFLARTATLIVSALAGTARALPELPATAETATARADLSLGHLGGVALRQTARSMVRQVYRRLFATPNWCVGWRRLDGPDMLERRGHPDTGWRILPDDGQRFYADPFPIEHRGTLTLFVEEFAHRLGKGVISAITFGPDGPAGRPEVVLELPYHLSYPFVFVQDGAVWMIPESSASGTVDLFRATAFPGGWVKEHTLVSGVVASDATLVEHGGKWWMFATVRDGGGAFSDALHLWHAPDFRGPWTPHPANPVMIDIASARPAGRMVVREDTMLRPVQDCRRGYGAALAIARVLQLDETGFAQTVETILTSGPKWPGRRLHTLNSAGGFEFIDGSANARSRFRVSRG